MKTIKFRVALERYTGNEVDTETIKGEICSDEQLANVSARNLIEKKFHERLAPGFAPKRGFDPMGCTVVYSAGHWYIWHDYEWKDSPKFNPVYVARVYPVVCDFNTGHNMIHYKSMRINKLYDKWYVVDMFNYRVYGTIDHNNELTLNSLLDKADKLYEEFHDVEFDPLLFDRCVELEDN